MWICEFRLMNGQEQINQNQSTYPHSIKLTEPAKGPRFESIHVYANSRSDALTEPYELYKDMMAKLQAYSKITLAPMQEVT
jgi:hypothetical protein